MVKYMEQEDGYYRELTKCLNDADCATAGYIITDSPNGTLGIITGGNEIVATITTDPGTLDIQAYALVKKKEYLSYKKSNALFIDPVEFVKLDRIQHLLKYYTNKKISKETALKLAQDPEVVGFGDNIESSILSLKQEIEERICYIYEQKPTTNSLALAKQFNLNHIHVIEKLLDIASQFPSLYNGLRWGPYAYKTKTATSYALYLEVAEDVYHAFLQSMGTPKSQEMRILRKRKIDEYYSAFQNLRDDLYQEGKTNVEVKDLIDLRTVETKKLMNAINTFVTHYNETRETGVEKLSYEVIRRIVFNLVNLGVDINSTKFPINRGDLDYDIQKKLTSIESMIYGWLKRKTIKRPKNLFRGILCLIDPNFVTHTIKEMDNEIINLLKEYNSDHLFLQIKD